MICVLITRGHDGVVITRGVGVGGYSILVKWCTYNWKFTEITVITSPASSSSASSTAAASAKTSSTSNTASSWRHHGKEWIRSKAATIAAA